MSLGCFCNIENDFGGRQQRPVKASEIQVD